jgi:SAM-dependent methyltransferase
MIEKKMNDRVRRVFYFSLAALGFKTMYWHLKKHKADIEVALGCKNCIKLFGINHRFHKKIAKEKDYRARQTLYMELYEAIYNFVKIHLPDYDSFGFNSDLINNHIDVFKDKIVIDYGCGYGASTELLSKTAKFVYGIDASHTAVQTATSKFGKLKNTDFIMNSSPYIPFEKGIFEAAYSNDLLEHFHPDDLKIHLKEIYRILIKGGKYLFWTPGSKTGPHDCTQWFYPRGMGFKAKGDHIKEYNYSELISIIQHVGFEKIELPDLTKEVLMIVTK